MNDILETVALATSLREGSEGVARVLRAIHRGERIELKTLSREVRLPVPVLAAVRRELEKAGLLTRDSGLRLSPEGERFVAEEMGLSTRFDATCPTCSGRRVVLDEGLEETVERLRTHLDRMPTVDVTLDQAFATAETAVLRALYLHRAGGLEGRSLLVLGDDDLLSVAVGLLAQALDRERLARRVTVLEIDERIRGVLEQAAEEEGLDIEVRAHDLRQPLPDDLQGAFDVFETDPPYTRDGVRLFVSRALEGIDPGIGRMGFLSLGPRDPDEHLAIQRDLADMGLVITDLVPAFNRYQGASLLGGTSQILCLETTFESAPALTAEPFEDALYTGERHPSRRLYRCLGCGEGLKVGQGAPHATVESLKAAGCPRCGGTRFRYLRRLRRPGGPVTTPER